MDRYRIEGFRSVVFAGIKANLLFKHIEVSQEWSIWFSVTTT